MTFCGPKEKQGADSRTTFDTKADGQILGHHVDRRVPLAAGCKRGQVVEFDRTLVYKLWQRFYG